MINVTKTYLPPLDKYIKYLARIWQTANLTNRGPLLLEFEEKLKNHLGVKNLLFVTNGTLALQISIQALDLKGEIITTPFSYVATTNSILWEHCTPKFADINPLTLGIDELKIEKLISKDTTAILAVHVYGYPCNVAKIEEIAKKHQLKIIYDAAHAFDVKLRGQSVLNFGDISTLSFHATKLFHTIEGGAIIVNDDSLVEKTDLLHRFGHHYDDFKMVGINAKSSEFQAAMGLCLLDDIAVIKQKRLEIIDKYYSNLQFSGLAFPVCADNVEYNGAYCPVIFPSEYHLLNALNDLRKISVNPRRYFYPSLNTLSYLDDYQICVNSEDLSKRVLCLPLYPDLPIENVNEICEVIIKSLRR
jgi:dTDP-4-amino-4,6-dideoxygalactose transaminase